MFLYLYIVGRGNFSVISYKTSHISKVSTYIK